MLYSAWGHDVNFPVYIALSIVLTLAAGVCSWHVVEKWLVVRRHKPLRQPAI